MQPPFLSKLTALFLLSCFILSESFSYAQAPSAPQPVFPSQLGTIEESYQGHSGKTLIYIQDAHDSLQAQENIAKLIDYGVEHYGIKTVFEEGYEGDVPTDQYFGFIKDPTVRQKVSWFLLDKLRLGGAEYAHINRKRDFRLTGADNLNLHYKNILAYQAGAKFQKLIASDLAALTFEINRIVEQRFPPQMKEWMKWKARFEQHQMDLLDYARRMGGKFQARPENYPALSLILSAEHTQNEILAQKIKAIRPVELFQEIDRLENEFSRAFLKEEGDRKTFEYYKNLELLKRLNRIELTPSEYEAAQKTLKTFDTRSLAEFVVRESAKPVVLSKQWEKSIRKARAFYEISRERDAPVEKRLNEFRKSADPAAILVFGGFHKDRIREILRRNGFSYLILSPKITSTDEVHQGYYRQLMSKGYLAFEVPLYVTRAARAESRFMQARLGGTVVQNTFRNELRDLVRQNGGVRSESRVEVEWLPVPQRIITILAWDLGIGEALMRSRVEMSAGRRREVEDLIENDPFIHMTLQGVNTLYIGIDFNSNFAAFIPFTAAENMRLFRERFGKDPEPGSMFLVVNPAVWSIPLQELLAVFQHEAGHILRERLHPELEDRNSGLQQLLRSDRSPVPKSHRHIADYLQQYLMDYDVMTLQLAYPEGLSAAQNYRELVLSGEVPADEDEKEPPKVGEALLFIMDFIATVLPFELKGLESRAALLPAVLKKHKKYLSDAEYAMLLEAVDEVVVPRLRNETWTEQYVQLFNELLQHPKFEAATRAESRARDKKPDTKGTKKTYAGILEVLRQHIQRESLLHEVNLITRDGTRVSYYPVIHYGRNWVELLHSAAERTQRDLDAPYSWEITGNLLTIRSKPKPAAEQPQTETRQELRSQTIENNRPFLSAYAGNAHLQHDIDPHLRSYVDRHREQWTWLHTGAIQYLIQRSLSRTHSGEKPRLVLMSLGASTGEELLRHWYEVAQALRAEGENPEHWDIQVIGLESDGRAVKVGNEALRGEAPFLVALKPLERGRKSPYELHLFHDLNQQPWKVRQSIRLLESDASQPAAIRQRYPEPDLISVNNVIRSWREGKRKAFLAALNQEFPNTILALGDLGKFRPVVEQSFENRSVTTVVPITAKGDLYRETIYTFGLPEAAKEWIDDFRSEARNLPSARSESRAGELQAPIDFHLANKEQLEARILAAGVKVGKRKLVLSSLQKAQGTVENATALETVLRQDLGASPAVEKLLQQFFFSLSELFPRRSFAESDLRQLYQLFRSVPFTIHGLAQQRFYDLRAIMQKAVSMATGVQFSNPPAGQSLQFASREFLWKLQSEVNWNIFLRSGSVLDYVEVGPQNTQLLLAQVDESTISRLNPHLTSTGPVYLQLRLNNALSPHARLLGKNYGRFAFLDPVRARADASAIYERSYYPMLQNQARNSVFLTRLKSSLEAGGITGIDPASIEAFGYYFGELRWGLEEFQHASDFAHAQSVNPGTDLRFDTQFHFLMAQSIFSPTSPLESQYRWQLTQYPSLNDKVDYAAVPVLEFSGQLGSLRREMEYLIRLAETSDHPETFYALAYAVFYYYLVFQNLNSKRTQTHQPSHMIASGMALAAFAQVSQTPIDLLFETDFTAKIESGAPTYEQKARKALALVQRVDRTFFADSPLRHAAFLPPPFIRSEVRQVAGSFSRADSRVSGRSEARSESETKAKLAKLLQKPADYDWEAHKEELREQGLFGFTGVLQSKTYSGGRVFFPIEGGFDYQFGFTGSEKHKDWKISVVSMEIKYNRLFITFRMEKEGEKTFEKTFFLGSKTRKLRSEDKQREIRVLDFLPVEEVQMDKLITLVTKPADYPWKDKKDELEQEGLLEWEDLPLGRTNGSGHIAITFTTNYTYYWRGTGTALPGLTAKVTRGRITEEGYELTVQFKDDAGEKSFERVFFIGKARKTIKGNNVEIGNKKEIWQITLPSYVPRTVVDATAVLVGRDILGRLAAKPADFDWRANIETLRKEGLLDFENVPAGITNSNGRCEVPVKGKYRLQFATGKSYAQMTLVKGQVTRKGYRLTLDMEKDGETFRRIYYLSRKTRPVSAASHKDLDTETALEFMTPKQLAQQALGLLVKKPLGYAWQGQKEELRSEGLLDLYHASLGVLGKAGDISFSPDKHYPYKWVVGRRYKGQKVKILKTAITENGYILRLELSDGEKKVRKNFRVTDILREISYDESGLNKKPYRYIQHVSVNPGIAETKKKLALLLRKEPGNDWLAREKELEAEGLILKDAPLGVIASNGTWDFAVFPNFYQSLTLLGRREKGWSGTIVEGKPDKWGYRLLLRFEKEGKPSFERVFYITDRTTLISGTQAAKDEPKRKILDPRSYDELIGYKLGQLVQKPLDYDWAAKEEELKREGLLDLKDLTFSNDGAGIFQFFPQANFPYLWRSPGHRMPGWKGRIHSSGVRNGNYEITVTFSHDTELSFRRTFVISRNPKSLRGVQQQLGNHLSVQEIVPVERTAEFVANEIEADFRRAEQSLDEATRGYVMTIAQQIRLKIAQGLWDDVAVLYTDFLENISSYWQHWFMNSYLADYFKRTGRADLLKEPVLYLGSGPSISHRIWRLLGYDPDGTNLDTSLAIFRADQARFNKEKVPVEKRPKYVVGDMLAIPFADKSWKRLENNSIRLVPAGLRWKAFEEMNRVLVQDGVTHVFIENGHFGDAIKASIAKAGFEIEEHFGIQLNDTQRAKIRASYPPAQAEFLIQKIGSEGELLILRKIADVAPGTIAKLDFTIEKRPENLTGEGTTPSSPSAVDLRELDTRKLPQLFGVEPVAPTHDGSKFVGQIIEQPSLDALDDILQRYTHDPYTFMAEVRKYLADHPTIKLSPEIQRRFVEAATLVFIYYFTAPKYRIYERFTIFQAYKAGDTNRSPEELISRLSSVKEEIAFPAGNLKGPKVVADLRKFMGSLKKAGRSEVRFIMTENIIFIDGAAQGEGIEARVEELAVLARRRKQTVVVYNMTKARLREGATIGGLLKSLRSAKLKAFINGNLEEALNQVARLKPGVNLVYYTKDETDAVEAASKMGSFAGRVTRIVGKNGALGYGLEHLHLGADEIDHPLEDIQKKDGYYLVSDSASQKWMSGLDLRYVAVFARAA